MGESGFVFHMYLKVNTRGYVIDYETSVSRINSRFQSYVMVLKREGFEMNGYYQKPPNANNEETRVKLLQKNDDP
jgi:hypothetical protein